MKSSKYERKDGGGLGLRNLKLPREKKSVIKKVNVGMYSWPSKGCSGYGSGFKRALESQT